MEGEGYVFKVSFTQISDYPFKPTLYCCSVHMGCVVHFHVFLSRFSSALSVPPSITNKGGMVTVVVNDPIRLECEASGLPAPSLTWLKEGSPISSLSSGIQVNEQNVKQQLGMGGTLTGRGDA